MDSKINNVERYPDDCARIQKVALKFGYRLSPEQAAELWEKHSDDFAAGWLIIDDDEDVERVIDDYSKELKEMRTRVEGATLYVGDSVRKVGGDYTFDGTVVAVFKKLSGKIRVVAEDDRGILHVFSEKNLEKI